ncbi:hypothetical protein SAMN05421805_10752 [Saccharopolyspora antimicrobica]|uniref:Uncharacterized protein n=1 Tax=Saccharopolyspora antimicrobica TaxID=455193 RepID=A0A1I5C378_9PSEU|nr:hypothetical protein ATL45_7429 [Saccharopolyspora antimicrobica]SFN81530.1 hypothetical protein SAMN05421805_10752 [Saccharopolyspora antimicrobica]
MAEPGPACSAPPSTSRIPFRRRDFSTAPPPRGKKMGHPPGGWPILSALAGPTTEQWNAPYSAASRCEAGRAKAARPATNMMAALTRKATW